MTMAKNLSKRHNEIDRIKMIKAMEFICRQINDEDVLDRWLALGVADGDISDGELSVYYNDDREELAFYMKDVAFADLMHEFLCCMVCASRSGGLYCAGVESKKEELNAEYGMTARSMEESISTPVFDVTRHTMMQSTREIMEREDPADAAH